VSDTAPADSSADIGSDWLRGLIQQAETFKPAPVVARPVVAKRAAKKLDTDLVSFGPGAWGI